MKRLGVLLLCIGLLSITACTSTKLTSSWKTPDARLDTSKKMIVIALVPPRDKKLRILMENELVNELQKEGFNAVSSFAKYGPDDALSKTGDEKAALHKFRNGDVDQVLTIAMVDKTKSSGYVPSYPYAPYYRGWYGGMFTPGYYTTNVRYEWDTNLYDLGQKKLIYNAQSEAIDPPTAYKQASQFARQIVRDMQRRQLFAKS
ncbi:MULTISPECIES: hypothetical protein [unclassified Chitinophaga]|uniref:hypothetical protein n=1 Tax=unclassified Chitinophaga TaxID=2619133 RepID=UPI0009C6493D|nr:MULTISPECIES: hypothetical protein [unclassified Chitinophaga]OMP79795.1 hypothetical protein BW716_07585 [[Flexibacter] sp. ATCC 35208]WPV68644.1 hypothetical protein QQL36_07925 [Chitinophaga sp. LS1]